MVYIKTLSNSKSDKWDQCRFAFLANAEYVEGTYKDSKRAAEFGKYIHKIFELNPSPSTLAELEATSEEIKRNYTFDKSYNSKTPKCLLNYLELVASFPPLEHPEPEWKYHIKVDEKILLSGVIDRMIKGKNGGILILDWKTGREIRKSDIVHNKQLMGYCLAVHLKFGIPIRKITCGLYYPISGNLLTTNFIKSQIYNFLKKEKDKFWTILKAKRIECQPTVNSFCHVCREKSFCPKFGGKGTWDLYEAERKRQKAIFEALEEKPSFSSEFEEVQMNPTIF